MNTPFKEINREGEDSKGPKPNIRKLVSSATEKAKETASKAQETVVGAIDKNGNGRIDREDFGLGEENLQEAKEKAAELATKAGENLRLGSEAVGKMIADVKLELDRKNLRPVFEEELLCGNEKERAICIVERDKKRSENEVCRGAVGYRTTVKGMELINLYEDCAGQVGITFYPYRSKTLYYSDPYQENFYISIDEYFSYFKKARVDELTRIAQDLGAKRIQVTLKESQKKSGKKEIHGEGTCRVGKFGEKLTMSHDVNSEEHTKVEIAKATSFSGNNVPAEPRVLYFKKERDIADLIQGRMQTTENQVQSQTYRFQYSKSLGINEKEAIQLDTVLKQLKLNGKGKVSVHEKVQSESRTELEYSIEF